MTNRVTDWRKSSYSGTETNCVEVGRTEDGAAVRDTKDRAAGYFAVSTKAWAAFVGRVKSGDLDG